MLHLTFSLFTADVPASCYPEVDVDVVDMHSLTYSRTAVKQYTPFLQLTNILVPLLMIEENLLHYNTHSRFFSFFAGD